MSLPLTDRVRRALVIAEEEAINDEADCIRIEHLVLAALRVQEEKDLEVLTNVRYSRRIYGS